MAKFCAKEGIRIFYTKDSHQRSYTFRSEPLVTDDASLIKSARECPHANEVIEKAEVKEESKKKETLLEKEKIEPKQKEEVKEESKKKASAAVIKKN